MSCSMCALSTTTRSDLDRRPLAREIIGTAPALQTNKWVALSHYRTVQRESVVQLRGGTEIEAGSH